MTENLNALTFMEYGGLCGETGREGYAKTSFTLNESPKEYWMWQDAPVMLGVPRGMALLQVMRAPGGPARTFYLDKPVCLRPGVPFAVLPLEIPCQMDLYALEGSVPLRFPRKEAQAPVLKPRVSIPCLYTLFYQEKPKGFYYPGESHAPYELTYVDMGRLHCVAGGRDVLLDQRELMLFAPRQWHMQYAPADKSVSFLTVSFDVLPAGLPLPCGVALRASKEIYACLAELLALMKAEGEYQGDMILCLCTQVLLLLLSQPLKERREPASPAENLLVEQALQYIDACCLRRVTVGEVAGHVHVSAGYLATLFKRQLNESPLMCIRRMRLAASRHLLLKGEKSIAQAASALGYATPQHFSRCFRKEFGFSPRDYIRSLKAAGAASDSFEYRGR